MRGVALVLLSLGVADLVWINAELGGRVFEADAVGGQRSTNGLQGSSQPSEPGPEPESQPRSEAVRGPEPEPELAHKPEPEPEPEPAQKAEPTRKSEPLSVWFKTSRANLSETSVAVLASVVETLKAEPRLTVVLTGHADVRGGEPINYRFGVRRARAVRRYLVRHGISVSRITVTSEGETKPRAPGDDAVAHRANRRVEITLLSTQALR